MKSFIKKHPFISVQIFSIVLAFILFAVLIVVALFDSSEFYFVTFYICWAIFAPILQLAFSFIIAMNFFEKSLTCTIISMITLPTTWLALPLLIGILSMFLGTVT